jgi:hypothetical protein
MPSRLLDPDAVVLCRQRALPAVPTARRSAPVPAPGDVRAARTGRLRGGPFIIAITDTQVVVLSCGWFKRHKPKSVWARYPRAVQLGPVNTSLAPTFTIGNLVLETDEEYVSVI